MSDLTDSIDRAKPAMRSKREFLTPKQLKTLDEGLAYVLSLPQGQQPSLRKLVEIFAAHGVPVSRDFISKELNRKKLNVN